MKLYAIFVKLLYQYYIVNYLDTIGFRWLKIAKRPEPNPGLCLPIPNDPSLTEETVDLRISAKTEIESI